MGKTRIHLDTADSDANRGLFGNKTIDEVTSYLPILGTIQDGYQLYKNPSWSNLGWFGLSLASDMLGASILKGLKAGKRLLRAARTTEQARTANYYGHLINMRRQPVTANTTKDLLEARRLQQALQNASVERARLEGINRINKALQYPVYGLWLGEDAGVNYMQHH